MYTHVVYGSAIIQRVSHTLWQFCLSAILYSCLSFANSFAHITLIFVVYIDTHAKWYVNWDICQCIFTLDGVILIYAVYIKLRWFCLGYNYIKFSLQYVSWRYEFCSIVPCKMSHKLSMNIKLWHLLYVYRCANRQPYQSPGSCCWNVFHQTKISMAEFRWDRFHGFYGNVGCWVLVCSYSGHDRWNGGGHSHFK